MKKRIISMIMAFVMIVSCISSIGVTDVRADEAQDVFNRIGETKKYIELELEKLHLYNDSDFELVRKIPIKVFMNRGLNLEYINTDMKIIEATDESNGTVILTVHIKHDGLDETWELFCNIFNQYEEQGGSLNVTVGGVSLSKSRPYWVNGATSATASAPASGYNAYFDADSMTLTLDGAQIEGAESGINSYSGIVINVINRPSTITVKNSESGAEAIHVEQGDIVIDGNGDFNLQGGITGKKIDIIGNNNITIESKNWGLHAWNDINIECDKLVIDAQVGGICIEESEAKGKLYLKKGYIDIKSNIPLITHNGTVITSEKVNGTITASRKPYGEGQIVIMNNYSFVDVKKTNHPFSAIYDYQTLAIVNGLIDYTSSKKAVMDNELAYSKREEIKKALDEWYKNIGMSNDTRTDEMEDKVKQFFDERNIELESVSAKATKVMATETTPGSMKIVAVIKYANHDAEEWVFEVQFTAMSSGNGGDGQGPEGPVDTRNRVYMGGGIVLDKNTPYWINGSTEALASIPKGTDYNVYYDVENQTLIIDGAEISGEGYGLGIHRDLHIVFKNRPSKFTSGNPKRSYTAITTEMANATIDFETDVTFDILQVNDNTDVIVGIAAHTGKLDINVEKNVDLDFVLDAESRRSWAISKEKGNITINNDGNINVHFNNRKDGEMGGVNAISIHTGNLTINGTGNLNVDERETYYSTGLSVIYGDIILNSSGNMNINMYDGMCAYNGNVKVTDGNYRINAYRTGIDAKNVNIGSAKVNMIITHKSYKEDGQVVSLREGNLKDINGKKYTHKSFKDVEDACVENGVLKIGNIKDVIRMYDVLNDALDKYAPSNNTTCEQLREYVLNQYMENGIDVIELDMSIDKQEATYEDMGSIKIHMNILDEEGVREEWIFKIYIPRLLKSDTVQVTTTETVKDDKAPQTDIKTDKDDLTNAVLTEEDLKKYKEGDNIDVWLVVREDTSTVKEKDKEKIDNQVDNFNKNNKVKYKVASYLDIQMFKKIGEEEAENVTELNRRIKIEMDVPNSLVNNNPNVSRKYKIIRIHNGEVKEIEAEYDKERKKLIFYTEEFSTYAIAYGDENITLDKVKGLKTVAYTKAAIKFSWNKVTGAEGYRVYVWKNKKWQGLKNVTATSYVHTGLASGTTYTYCVRPYKKTDSGVVWGSLVKLTTATQVKDVATIKVAKKTSRAATITWGKVTGASGYRLYVWNGKKWVYKAAVKNPKYTFTGLSKNKYYQFAVRPYKTVNGKAVLSQKVKSIKVKTNR